jgi:hypothetical protein
MKKYKALNCNKNVIFKNIPHTLQESVDIMKRKWDLNQMWTYDVHHFHFRGLCDQVVNEFDHKLNTTDVGLPCDIQLKS